MSLGAERCVTSSHLWESRASKKGKCGKTNIGACTAEKKSSLGLGRVPAAHTLFSRGCSPKTSETLVARREAAVTTATTTGADLPALAAQRATSWEPARTSGLRSLSAGKEQGPVPKPRTRLVLPLAWQGPSETREARERCCLQKLREIFGRAEPASGLGGTKGRELGQHWSRRGRHAGSRGGTRGRGMSQGKRPGKRASFPANWVPLKTLSETAPRRELASSPRAPGLVLPNLAPGRRQRVGGGGGGATSPLWPSKPGAGNPTSPARADRADPAGAGEVPRSGNFLGGGAAGRARCVSPEPRDPEPPGRRLPGPRGPAGCASPVRPRVGVLPKGEKWAGAGRRGRRGCGRPSGGRRNSPVRHQLKAPAPPPPALVAGRPAWAEGLFVSKLP